MSWLANLASDIAEALYPGAKAIVKKSVDRAVESVVKSAKAFIDSWLKEVTKTGAADPADWARKHRKTAEELAEEEAYLAEKIKHDGRRSPADADRIQEINAVREKLREEVGETSGVQAAQQIAGTEGLISTRASQDELASQVGILSTKQCPSCGGNMTLRLGRHNTTTGQNLYWCCNSERPFRCPTLSLRPAELAQQVSVRQPNADLDGSPAGRKEWAKDSSRLAKTAGRVRSHLGDDDEAIICPVHLLPMKLLQAANAGGRLLDSYQYVCLGVFPDGRACNHTVPVASFGQVSGMLTRTEGRGIF
jgi:hypothetical protein